MNETKVLESVNYIKEKINFTPAIGIILGSGLGDMAEDVEEKVIVKYSDVPNLPKTTVKGHKGQFVFGKVNNKYVVMMQGRFHYYEGNKMEDVVLPVYIMKYLEVKALIVTNAAGGVNKDFNAGDLMLIKDHVNFAFNNPLIGKNDENLGTRFPDISSIYDKNLINIAKEAADSLKIEVKEGTYFMFTGPNYETPAEVRMAGILGGDAVGMSTVPEAIAAAHCRLSILGISCITNMAAGILDKPLNHEEVIETSNKVKNKFISLVKEIIKRI